MRKCCHSFNEAYKFCCGAAVAAYVTRDFVSVVVGFFHSSSIEM